MNRPRSTHCDDALVIEQFASMTQNIPAVFFNILIMSTIFCWFIHQEAPSNTVLAVTAPLVAVCGARALYWRRLGQRKHDLSIAKQKRMLRTVWILCLCLCCGFSSIVVFNLSSPDIFVQATIAILIIASSITIALHLFVLPPAALGTLWSATASTIFVFVRSQNSILIAASVAILVIAVAITRLLAAHFDNFRKLVLSRAEIDEMREDAVKLAMTDALTGLPNRRMFEARMKACAKAGAPFAVAVLDLDGFKPINDIYGHAVGDLFLTEAARRMQGADESLFVARVGGDEFAMLIEQVDSAGEAAAIAQRAVDLVSALHSVKAVAAAMSASCGLALWRRTGDEDRLVERADIALYQAKDMGRGAVAVFSEALENEVRRHALIESGLRDAVTHDEFEVHFQPIVDLRTCAITGFEALARWRHAELGDIPPNVFIPIAEQSGLIEVVTDRLLRKAARAATRWPNDISLSFNLSATQLVRPAAAQAILGTLAECGLDPRRFGAEVTETAIMTDVSAATATISALKLAGVSVSLDDFGTGYSSFSELCELPLDCVKIDKKFVDRICSDPRAASIVSAIVKMCASLDLTCVAEGVEHQEQRELLVSLGCQKGQGFLISRPAAERAALDLLPEAVEEQRKSA